MFTATAPGVSDFSSWSAGVLAPTAANASISGRAVGADGRGLANVTIEARGTDGSLAGSGRTNSFCLCFRRFTFASGPAKASERRVSTSMKQSVSPSRAMRSISPVTCFWISEKTLRNGLPICYRNYEQKRSIMNSSEHSHTA